MGVTCRGCARRWRAGRVSSIGVPPYEVTVFIGKLLFLLVSYFLPGADAMSPYEVTFFTGK